MRILMVNKFLHPNGGSETYMFKLGGYLQSQGHEVEYFGMDHEDRIVGNSAGCYVGEMNYHTNSLKNLLSPFKTIYSWEARRKINVVLNQFQPDIVHLNNINFQLTPSIFYEIKKHGIPMVQTIHDPQIGCPCHRMFIDHTQQVCARCLDGKYRHCIENRCVSGSLFKSIIAAIESRYYHNRNTYALVDKFICPSAFMAGILRQSNVGDARLAILRNFPTLDTYLAETSQERNYVLYFGRYSVEKGIRTLVKACQKLQDIPFVFAGVGPLSNELSSISNITNIGFQTGNSLRSVIAGAAFSVYPSIWYENCPLSVLESQMLGTPVVGANIGGIPELIIPGVTGELFESGNSDDLTEKISALYKDGNRLRSMQERCTTENAFGIGQYYSRLMDIYEGVQAAREYQRN